MRINNQYVWNFVFTVFFLILVVMGAIILDTEARMSLTDLTLTDYVLITLASWRLLRLFIYDAITKFFREQFWDAAGIGEITILEKPKSGPRRTLADLLSCPWCFGVWATATVTFFYLLSDWAIFPIIILALSAVATFLQLLANLIGNAAERMKS